MRVAMVNLTGGGMSGGYRKYLLSLVPRLRERPGLELDVYVPPPLVEPLAAAGLDGLRPWEGAAALRTTRPDVVFVPSARLVEAGPPCVVMVRNMEPLERPLQGNSPAAALRNLARAWAARRACTRAARVIAVSEHVAAFLRTRWRLPADRIGVVYHGVDPVVVPPSPPEALRAVEPGRFFFTAGSLRPARGLEDAIAALSRLPQDAPPLVVAGSADPDSAGHARHLRALSERLGVAGAIVWAGGLDASAMAWAYANCSAFVMTSRCEACPNTVLEALAHGCVSVSIERPPMTELYDEAALYYRAGDATGLAAGLAAALALDRAGRQAVADRARARAAGFSWERTAERTLEQLERARA